MCTFEDSFLRSEPRDHVGAPAAQRPSPMQALERLGLLAGPPVFLDHHQYPTVSARARQREDLDTKAVARSRKTVAVTLPIHAVDLPVRGLQSGIGRAHQQIEQSIERWAGEIFHSPSLRTALRRGSHGRFTPTPVTFR